MTTVTQTGTRTGYLNINAATHRILAYSCRRKDGSRVLVGDREGIWSSLGSPEHSTFADHVLGRCDHCGIRLQDLCVLQHKASGQIATIERSCIHRHFNEDWPLYQASAIQRDTRQRNIATYLHHNPNAYEALIWALEGDGRSARVPHEIAQKIAGGIEVSPAQTRVIAEAHRKWLAPVTYETGRRIVEGTVIKTAILKDDFGSTRLITAYDVRVTVREASGVKAHGCLPSAAGAHLVPGNESLVTGRTCRFLANVEARDSEFATFKRPTKFEFTDGKDGVKQP